MTTYRIGALTLFAPRDEASVRPFLSAMKPDTAGARGHTQLDATFPDREFSPNAAREAEPV